MKKSIVILFAMVLIFSNAWISYAIPFSYKICISGTVDQGWAGYYPGQGPFEVIDGLPFHGNIFLEYEGAEFVQVSHLLTPKIWIGDELFSWWRPIYSYVSLNSEDKEFGLYINSPADDTSWVSIELNYFHDDYYHDSFLMWIGDAYSGDNLWHFNSTDFSYRIKQLPVPEPTTMLLFCSGLICLIGFKKKLIL
jgi:hypothetical protein